MEKFLCRQGVVIGLAFIFSITICTGVSIIFISYALAKTISNYQQMLSMSESFVLSAIILFFIIIIILAKYAKLRDYMDGKINKNKIGGMANMRWHNNFLFQILWGGVSCFVSLFVSEKIITQLDVAAGYIDSGLIPLFLLGIASAQMAAGIFSNCPSDSG